jgi:hypothetical protein
LANYFNLTLDTTAPASPTISIEGGATYATQQLVNLTIGTSDGTTTGYQMKIWGDVDTAYDGDVKDTEGGSAWITYATTKQIKLSAADGSKTIYLRIRDDVYNQSAQVSDSINLDTTLPVVTIAGPDVTKISKIVGKDVCSFSFQVDGVFAEYVVKVVTASGAAHDTGVQIPTTAGSTNMSGNSGNYPATTPINCTIKGTDLETASTGDANKIIKVFVRDSANQWSA